MFQRNKLPLPPKKQTTPEKLLRVGCPAHDCGGRCLLIAHIQAGVITRLDADDRPDSPSTPQLRACTRGRSYLRRQYHPDRLLYPLKRIGQRGEGKFTRITWEEAFDTIASQILRVRKKFGNSAMFVPQGTGNQSQVNASQLARRLLNLCGGSLQYHGSYSCSAANAATTYIYGTLESGSQRQDWLNSRYILMWGWNPAEMRDGTNSDYYLKQARKNGARIVCIDPRHSFSAACLADEWIPIRPGTDAAFLSAMAHVIITEKRTDESFVRTHCSGFNSAQMPAGLEDLESYSDYILGIRDGIPKTPQWAEKITQVPAGTIARIAREYASLKPGMLYQGWGMQRRGYGETAIMAGCALAAITGNVGIPGGWAGGRGDLSASQGPTWSVFPIGDNPVNVFIPVFSWTEAIVRGTEMTAGKDGILGADRLENNIKLIMGVATNILINQHGDINRTARILGDEKLVEFISIQDNFLTSSARFADVVLPVCTQFETWGLNDGWKYGDEIILLPKLVEPPGDCKSDFEICSGLADRLGVGEAFRDGRDERGWVEWCLERQRERRFPKYHPLMSWLIATTASWTGRLTSRWLLLPISAVIQERIPCRHRRAKLSSFPPHFTTCTILKYLRCRSIYRNGKAPWGSKLKSTRSRQSVTTACRECIQPITTMTGSWRHSPSVFLSTRWMPNLEELPMVTPWRYLMTGAGWNYPAGLRTGSYLV